MQTSPRGVATAVLAISVIVVIAVAGGAAYLVLSSGPSSSTTTSSHSGSTTVSSSSTSKPATTTSTTKTTSVAPPTTTTGTPHTSTTTTTSSAAASTTASFTCASTTTTTTGGTATDLTPQYIATIKQYSSMEFSLSDNTNGTTTNSTFAYQVTGSSGGIYNVNVTGDTGGQSFNILFAVDANNNSVLSATSNYSGYNYTVTGSTAQAEFAVFGIFGLEYTYSNELSLFTSSSYFHSTGTTTMTFGSASFPVTTYVANSLPETLNDCGVNSLLTAYTLEVGTPTGSSLAFITYFHVAGTDYSSGTTTFDYVFQLVSMTVA